MREIVYARLDDRLVHGQIVAVWLNEMKCDVLLVADDKAANDSFQQMLLKMAVPKSTKFELRTVESAIEYLNSEGNEKVFLIFGKLESVKDFIRNGGKLSELNLGNIGNNKERKQYSKAIWLTDSEVEITQELRNNGLDINIHLVPSEKKYKLDEIIN